MRVVEEEFEQLKFPFRENRLLSLVTQYPAFRIEPQPLELPNTPIPEVQATVVAGHLVLIKVTSTSAAFCATGCSFGSSRFTLSKRPSLKRIRSS